MELKSIQQELLNNNLVANDIWATKLMQQQRNRLAASEIWDLKISPKAKAQQSERKLQAKVSAETKKLQSTFSWQECMQISYVPLIITQIAWMFTFDGTDKAAQARMSEMKAMSRELKTVRKSYIETLKLDLDQRHIEAIENQAASIRQTTAMDFYIFRNVVNVEMKNAGIENDNHIEVVTDFHCAVLMIDFLREHNARITEMMRTKIPTTKDMPLNPAIEWLYSLLKVVTRQAPLPKTIHIERALKIFQNNLKRIKWELD